MSETIKDCCLVLFNSLFVKLSLFSFEMLLFNFVAVNSVLSDDILHSPFLMLSVTKCGSVEVHVLSQLLQELLLLITKLSLHVLQFPFSSQIIVSLQLLHIPSSSQLNVFLHNLQFPFSSQYSLFIISFVTVSVRFDLIVFVSSVLFSIMTELLAANLVMLENFSFDNEVLFAIVSLTAYRSSLIRYELSTVSNLLTVFESIVKFLLRSLLVDMATLLSVQPINIMHISTKLVIIRSVFFISYSFF